MVYVLNIYTDNKTFITPIKLPGRRIYLEILSNQIISVILNVCYKIKHPPYYP